MRTRPLALLAIALLLASLLPVPPALAQEPTPDDEGGERRVGVDVDGDAVVVSLVPLEGESGDLVEVLFTSSDATLTVAHSSGQRRPALETRLGPLIEYEDEDGNGSFDPGEPIVSAWALEGESDDGDDVNGSVDWGDAKVTNVTRSGNEGKRVVIQGDLGEDGQATLRFEAFGEHAAVANGTLTPTGAAVDLMIESFPFQRNGTGLAMLLTSEASGDREVNRQHGTFDEAEESVVITPTDEGAEGLLIAWQDNATVDGVSAPVTTTDVQEGVEGTPRETGPDDEQPDVPGDPNVTEVELALSYPRGDVVVHQLRTDVIASSAEASDETPGPAASLVLLAIALAGLAVQRPRA